MGDRKKTGRIAALCILMLMIPVNAQTVSADCDIEQISLDMPDIRMYYRAEEAETSYEAYLGGEALEYESSALFSELGEGVDYYLMLDISASIPDNQFENLKTGITQFISEKGPKDKCVLLTFGNESKVVLDGSEPAEEAAQTISQLKNDDQETVLFQSIVQAAGMIEQEAQTEEKRRVIITVTDGEDCVTGQATASEALSVLKQKGIPLYAVAVDIGKQEYVNSFGEFSRNSGGILSIYSTGNSADVFAQIRKVIQGSYAAFFKKSTNIASNKREDFTIKFLDHKTTRTQEVVPMRWKPDKEAPSVKSCEIQGDNELKLTFSELVLGADAEANYKVERDGEAVAVGSVFYSPNDPPQTVITFEKPVYTGEYTLSFSNITDNSMEKNALPASAQFYIEGAEPEKEPEPGFLEKWWWLVFAVVLAALAAAVTVGIVLYRKVKKNRGIIYVDGKAALASNVDVKQHVSVKELPQMHIRLILKDAADGQKDLKCTINGSMIVGRSKECELCFDDLKMSRQHFALETDGENIYISDLESQNGTLVNGVFVQQRRKLQPGDEIGAGNIQFRIQW